MNMDSTTMTMAIGTELNNLNNIIQKYSDISSQLTGLNNKIDIVKSAMELKEEASAILIKSSEVMRSNAKNHFEKIVTDALQFISQDSTYKFVIEESQVRGKPAYEFYIETMVNGVVSRQKPEDACGGGFIDIISVTMKTAYLEIFQSPRIMNSLLVMDEPGKMISEDMTIKFAEFVKFLGNKFNKQQLMITHKKDIANVADTTFYVRKNAKGVSEVSNVLNVNLDENILEGELNESYVKDND